MAALIKIGTHPAHHVEICCTLVMFVDLDVESIRGL